MNTIETPVLTYHFKIDDQTASRLKQELEEADLDNPEFDDYVFDDRYEVVGELPDYILRYWYLIRYKEDECVTLAETFALQRMSYLGEKEKWNHDSFINYLAIGYDLNECVEDLEYDCDVLRAQMLQLAKEHFVPERISDKPIMAVCGRTLVQDDDDSPLVAKYKMPRIDVHMLWAFGFGVRTPEPAEV